MSGKKDAMEIAMDVLPYVPLIIYETIQVTDAIQQDVELGTTRNTLEAAVGALGAACAATGGAAAGASICPKAPLLGATLGATQAGLAGDMKARQQANQVFDKHEYNMEVLTCELCGTNFLFRKYARYPRKRCKNCMNKAE